MALELYPINDRVLVRIETHELSELIWTPHAERHDARSGEVVALGVGRTTHKGAFIETTLRPGDRVVFPFYSGAQIRIGGVPHCLLREEEIFGVLGADESFSPVDGS